MLLGQVKILPTGMIDAGLQAHLGKLVKCPALQRGLQLGHLFLGAYRLEPALTAISVLPKAHHLAKAFDGLEGDYSHRRQHRELRSASRHHFSEGDFLKLGSLAVELARHKLQRPVRSARLEPGAARAVLTSHKP